MWFYETLYPDIKLAIKGKLIFKKKTSYQDLRIYKTARFGKVLLLDGAIQTTEKDEYIYHEMLTHPVLLAHPRPKDILVIGAGDGGVLREVLKYKIKQVTLVEIDEEVIRASEKFLPSLHRGSFRDRRLNLIIADGAEFVRTTKEKFDVAIIDSPDPVGAARVLFSKRFYKDIYSVLKENGMLIRQTGSTILQSQEIKQNYGILSQIFPSIAVQLAAIPTYIGGFFSFLIASRGIDINGLSLKQISNRYKRLGLQTKYYNPGVHFASKQLPTYIERALT
jgi:spermidine synthase